jgi:hypothetical protein
MSTPVSGLTPYCTLAQFFAKYDVRTVGDLMSDTGTRLTPTVLNDPVTSPVLIMLTEASGWVEAAALKSERYSVLDLQTIINQPLVPTVPPSYEASNSAEMLAGLVAGIAMFFIWDRRPERMSKAELPMRAQMALDMLEQLKEGSRIFSLQETAKAGVPAPVYVPFCRTYTPTKRARRFFGNTGDLRAP